MTAYYFSCCIPGSSKDLCRPLMVKNNQCGTIPFPVLDVLQNYQDTFPFVKDDKTGNIKYVTVSDQLITADQRTQAIDIIVKQFREKKVFVTLDGWRDEVIFDSTDLSCINMGCLICCMLSGVSS